MSTFVSQALAFDLERGQELFNRAANYIKYGDGQSAMDLFPEIQRLGFIDHCDEGGNNLIYLTISHLTPSLPTPSSHDDITSYWEDMRFRDNLVEYLLNKGCSFFKENNEGFKPRDLLSDETFKDAQLKVLINTELRRRQEREEYLAQLPPFSQLEEENYRLMCERGKLIQKNAELERQLRDAQSQISVLEKRLEDLGYNEERQFYDDGPQSMEGQTIVPSAAVGAVERGFQQGTASSFFTGSDAAYGYSLTGSGEPSAARAERRGVNQGTASSFFTGSDAAYGYSLTGSGAPSAAEGAGRRSVNQGITSLSFTATSSFEGLSALPMLPFEVVRAGQQTQQEARGVQGGFVNGLQAQRQQDSHTPHSYEGSDVSGDERSGDEVYPNGGLFPSTNCRGGFGGRGASG
ncbi:GAS domain-containing protein [Rickettsiales bacterium]|nr:GAS domain-containing protein [Rickettsiales bacterium]